MDIKTFIEKAIEGEYNGTSYAGKQWAGIRTFKHPPQTIDDQARFCAVLIDPKSWQAVGKVEGWTSVVDAEKTFYGWTPKEVTEHRIRMHRFIDALCDGKDLEGAVEEATK